MVIPFLNPESTKLAFKLEHDRLTFPFPEIAGQLTAKLIFPAQKLRCQGSPVQLPPLLTYGHRPPLVPCATASVSYAATSVLG